MAYFKSSPFWIEHYVTWLYNSWHHKPSHPLDSQRNTCVSDR